MLEVWLPLILGNFGLSMFVLAILSIVVHLMISGARRITVAEIVFRWMILFGVGFTGIYTFIMHAFFADFTAAHIGWASSPFQYEVAMANLSVGVLGILSFKASYSFRLATVIGVTCWLWGDAGVHIYHIIVNQNYTTGNAGSWFWLDVLIPLILIICIIKLRLHQRK